MRSLDLVPNVTPPVWLASLASLVFLACGGDAEPLQDGGAPDGDTCICDDGFFCNGLERCEDGACVPGDAPCEGVRRGLGHLQRLHRRRR
ncbi:MAG: hypothetical protein H6722_15255 [Sandaracinus sp.]|nr:hypothetical protein [Sandaracinus sp.]